MSNAQHKIADVFDALESGTASVQHDPSETNYRHWENKIESAGTGIFPLTWFLALGGIVILILALVVIPEGKTAHEAPIPPNPTSGFGTISVHNDLVLPVQISLDDINQRYLEAGSSLVVNLMNETVNVKWRVSPKTISGGLAMGHEMSGGWIAVRAGSSITINSTASGMSYFYPIISNETDMSCEFVVNDGYPNVDRPGAYVAKRVSRVGLGYYRFFSNSNVTLYCDNGQTYVWGIRNGDGKPLIAPQASGVIELRLPTTVIPKQLPPPTATPRAHVVTVPPPSATHRPSNREAPNQSCPVVIDSPVDFLEFRNADELTLSWHSAAGLESGHSYLLSFYTVDGAYLAAVRLESTDSTKPAGTPAWIYPDGEWIAEIKENSAYKWEVAVIDAGNGILCRSDSRTIIWKLHE